MIEEFLAFMVLLNYIIPISMYVTVGEYSHVVIVSCCFKWRRLMNKINQYLVQGSHRSGKSGNSGKILKTFSSQGNQGKTGVFQPKSGKKISNQGTFLPNHFQTF